MIELVWRSPVLIRSLVSISRWFDRCSFPKYLLVYAVLQGGTKSGAKSQKSSFSEMKEAKTWEFFHWIENINERIIEVLNTLYITFMERIFRSIFGMNFSLWCPVLVYMVTRCWWFLRALGLWHCCMMLVMTTLRCCDLFHSRPNCRQNACFLWHLLQPSVMVCLVGWLWLIGWAALGWCCIYCYLLTTPQWQPMLFFREEVLL